MTVENQGRPVVVGVTGASGSALARATIDLLLGLGVPVISIISPAAKMVWLQEMEESLGEALERWDGMGDFSNFAIGDMRAPIASGTFPTEGMAVVPCSMATAAAIAQGHADNLLRRAADVTIKERRPLVLVPRETPLSAIHLRNLADAALVGATVIPPEPAFYLGQRSVDDVVEYVAHRTALALGAMEELPERMRYSGPEGNGSDRRHRGH